VRFAELRNQREIVLEKRIMGDSYTSAARSKFAGRDCMQALMEQAAANPILGPYGTQIWPRHKREAWEVALSMYNY
jgi:hypothetical protein